MATRADIAVAEYLGRNVEILSLGENLFHGPPKPGNSLSVFCLVSGGISPVSILGTTTGLYMASVNIRIRGNKTKYDEGLVLAKSVQDTIQYSTLGTDFIMVRVVSSMPSYIGENKDGSPEWAIFTTVTFKE